MTMKPKASKFRLRTTDPKATDDKPQAARPTPPQQPQPRPQVQRPQQARAPQPEQAQEQPTPPVDANIDSPAVASAEAEIDAIRKEGLTGRQLRMARRVAQKHGLAVTSDFDAVRQLRQNGIDPFERSSILELVAPSGGGNGGGTNPPTGTALAAGGKMQLPQTIQQGRALTAPDPAAAAERRASEIMRIQQDLIRRRRQRLVSLFSRLAIFVLLPTLLAGYYYFVIATPMYATKSEFVIQQSQPAGGAAGGLSGLFQGTSLATQADAIAVQSYLTSRAAMVRLDEEEGFKAHFSQDHIDPIQRLDPNASNEAAYKLYQRLLTIGYDPTEGIVKMEMVAADPQTSQRFSEALISYAEEQVDQLTQRMREDQMSGANASYEEAEARRKEALEALLTIQEDLETFSPDSEAQLVMNQIGQLQTRRQDKILELASLQSVARPNEARVNAVNSEIASLETSIEDLLLQLTETTGSGNSLASKTTELRAAEENYQFQIALVQQALTMMETARLEANRQVRYLSLGVVPIAPDDPTYPKAFENTLVSFLIFAGIYLMFSLTASILREQVSS